jgi:hypothetical protein
MDGSRLSTRHSRNYSNTGAQASLACTPPVWQELVWAGSSWTAGAITAACRQGILDQDNMVFAWWWLDIECGLLLSRPRHATSMTWA